MVQFKIINNRVNVDKEVTKLDEFVLDSLSIIQKYADYAIISGYVSIFFGRARATEDVDLFISDISEHKFKEMCEEAKKKGYEWTIDNCNDLYHEYLKDSLPINMWKKDFPLLRMEIKLAIKPSQKEVMENPIIVKFNDYEIKMANIESQIAYKRYIAKSDKDLADARHLELVFSDLNSEKIKYYRDIFEKEFYGH